LQASREVGLEDGERCRMDGGSIDNSMKGETPCNTY